VAERKLEREERKEKMKSNTLVKILFAMAIMAILLSSSLLISPASSSLQPPTLKGQQTGSLKLPDKEWVDGTHTKYMESKKAAAQASSSMGISVLSAAPTDMEIMVSDFLLNVDYKQNFHLVWTGTHCYVYAALDSVAPILNYYDSSTDQYVFVNPNYPTGGWTPEDRISTAQLTYLGNEFDNTIYPIMTTTFGTPIPRPAGEDKIYILIMNMRDDAYYDSTINWYVAGYFSWGEDSACDKNMIHIDSFDWANRIGPGTARPYLYEGTFAHEFEHLIHNDIDPGEESWVDEGCADFAIYMCGYGHDAGHIANYLVYHPYTSLTFWGGGLESYGASYLFTLYLYEHFDGIPFIVDLVHNPLHSIEGVVDTLLDHGYTISFEQLFHNWAVANYIDDTSIGNGEYGYFTLDIPSLDTWGYSIEYALHNYWQGQEFNLGTYMKSSWWYGVGPQPYTAQYWDFAFTPSWQEVTFQYGGDPISGVPAHGGSYHWYGGMGNWVWRKLGQSFLIPAGGATLKFWTSYDIELDWDYAYVEVHDLTADTWTTLPGVKTTNTLPHEQDNPNVPAGREPKDYFHAGTWKGLTGNSGGYYQETMDLTPFANDNIELNFVYWTDGASNGMGIFMDDIEIPELGFSDNVEADVNGWTNEGWIRTTGLETNHWQGTVVDLKLPGTTLAGYRNPSFRLKMRSGKMVNFEPAMLQDIWDITGGLLVIPPEDITNRGHQHIFVAVFWNAVPHLFPGDYWFYAY
jgi:hypothetical protein